AGIYVAADDVVLYDLTLVGDTGNTLPRYGVKFGDFDGCWMEQVTVQTCYRTGVDILGATNLTVKDVTSTGNGGNGLQCTDARDVTFENITTSGNAWGGVGIFTYGRYTPLGTWGIVFTGTNSLGETSPVAQIYLEEGNYSDPPNPEPISYSTNILDGADVTVQLADVTHALHGNSDNSNNYVVMYASLTDAQTAASGPAGHITDDRYIEELGGTNWYVPAYQGGIQAAVDAAGAGDVVHIEAGTYVEQVEIDKNLTLDGAGKGSTIIQSPASLTASFVTGTNTNYPVVYVHDATDVTVSNLTVDGLGNGNANYRFIGIGYRNAGGEVSSCEILDIR
ncbi:MAG: right-handed parallel beta-helix repeat-containing protein, partial [Candidatus Latescibacterota bacterium]